MSALAGRKRSGRLAVRKLPRGRSPSSVPVASVSDEKRMFGTYSSNDLRVIAVKL